MGVLAGLEPQKVFEYFEKICAIPHGSSNTKQISDWLVAFAVRHGLRYRQDAFHNVIIWKDASAGYEDSAPVMIQGHMDMVCEKEADCDIDFMTDGLRLCLKDGVISAEGTTLGGDDGIAVAYALAILASEEIAHPPLEVVLTVDEEIGMLGAAALDCSDLKARTMLNLDSEDEGHLLVSCAGGATVKASLPVAWEAGQGACFRLIVSGLQGGHSGTEIDRGRGNACQLLGRVLWELAQHGEIRLLRLEGGSKDNAIPREASAEFVFSSDTEDCAVVAAACEETYRCEYCHTDPQISVSLERMQKTADLQVMTEESTIRAVTALYCFPGGVQRMSAEMEGLVQTSLNLGILQTQENAVEYSFSVRSSVDTEKKELEQRICCLAQALGAEVSCAGEYPAWEYRQDSPLRDRMIAVFEAQYGYPPVVESLHAGVECGLLAGKIPGLDCVSFGPDMDDIHTPNESMKVDSVQRTWQYILGILRQLR